MREIKVADLLKNRHTTGDKPEHYAIVVHIDQLWYYLEWLDLPELTWYKLEEVRKQFIVIS